MTAYLTIQLQFACRYRFFCHDETNKNHCKEEMMATVYKQHKSDKKYSWLSLQPFCRMQPTREEVLNALTERFKIDALVKHFRSQLKQKSVLEEAI